MVVHNLHNYVWKKVPRSSERISIKNLVEEHRKTYENPVLIIDGTSIAIALREKKLESKIHEFHLANYVNLVKEFVRALESLDIKLIFFFGAGRKVNKWQSHHPRSQRPALEENITSTFDSLRNGEGPEITYVIPALIASTRYVLKYECCCTVYCAMTDVDREIAQFAAITPECFAIFGKTADHLIFGEKPLLSSKSFDMTTTTTTISQRSELLAALEMKCQQLPMLACMAGNNIIAADSLANFHEEISPQYKGRDIYLIDKIRKFIRRKRWIGNDNELPEISQKLGIDEEILRKGIAYYNISEDNYDDNMIEDMTQTLPILREKCFQCSASSALYVILSLRKFIHARPMEDPNDDSIPSTVLIYRPIRQRMYYLLFDEESVRIEEWCAYRKKNSEEADLVRSIEVEVEGHIPLMRNLLSEEVEYEVRWKLFCACLEISIPGEELQKIETHLVTLCCLVNFLLHVEGVNLEEFEVKAFICQALRIELSSTIQDEEISIRAVTLAGILWEGYRNLLLVVPVCGFPFPFEDVMAWRYFNGKVFYWCYNDLRDAVDSDSTVRRLMDDDAEAINKFHRLYRMTVGGTRLG